MVGDWQSQCVASANNLQLLFSEMTFHPIQFEEHSEARLPAHFTLSETNRKGSLIKVSNSGRVWRAYYYHVVMPQVEI